MEYCPHYKRVCANLAVLNQQIGQNFKQLKPCEKWLSDVGQLDIVWELPGLV